MINLSNINSSNTLIVLRGEYGVIKGNDFLIAAPNLKNGSVLMIYDEINKVSSMTYFDGDDNLQANIEKILREMMANGADIANLKYNLITKEHNHE